MSLPPIWAIVLAGGSAQRFAGRPKQFERVGGLRMVDRTVGAARRTCDHVVLVLPQGRAWDGAEVDAVATGGAHQAESLRAALAHLPDADGIAVVCDPAHPLASDSLFRSVVDSVLAGADAAVPIIPILDVVQRVDAGRVVDTLPKTDLVITQAPQAFRLAALRAVHLDAPHPVDNSSVLVAAGFRVETVPGDSWNIHVATGVDLAIAEALAGATLPSVRPPSPSDRKRTR